MRRRGGATSTRRCSPPLVVELEVGFELELPVSTMVFVEAVVGTLEAVELVDAVEVPVVPLDEPVEAVVPVEEA